MTHEDVLDLLDAYVIGALDADEASELEAHLADCPSCSDALAEAAGFAGSLALTAPIRRHSDTLRAGVMQAAREKQPATRTSPRWYERVAGIAAAAAVSGVVVWAAVLQVQVHQLRETSDDIDVRVNEVRRQAPDLQAVKAQAQQAMSISRATYKAVDDYQTVLNVVNAPAVTHETMKAAPFAPDAAGEVYWDRERQIFAFMFANLPQCPEGKAYQVWLWKDGAASSGGSFAPSDRGFAALLVPETGSGLSEFDGIGVTLEDAAGAAAPSGPSVLQLPID